MLDLAHFKTPTAAEKQAANALIRPILTDAGIGETLRNEVESRGPFADPLELEIALGRSTQALAGSLPSGPLLHVAAATLIEDDVITVRHKPCFG